MRHMLRTLVTNVSSACYPSHRLFRKGDYLESAKVAELADAPDLGSGAERCGGSSPPFRTRECKQSERCCSGRPLRSPWSLRLTKLNECYQYGREMQCKRMLKTWVRLSGALTFQFLRKKSKP